MGRADKSGIAVIAKKRAKPLRRIRLSFQSADQLPHTDDPVRSDLSALALLDETLWVANDELATVERLRRTDAGYGQHGPFHLCNYFELPGGPADEMDIEGLEIDGGYLWVLGSHSLTREKPERGSKDRAESLRRLTEVERHPNRHFLGRIPIVGRDGTCTLERTVASGEGKLRAACLNANRKRGKLGRLLKNDQHVGRFIQVPAKENGFDLEGIAVRGSRVFLGLRGPVLRGWAVIVELQVKERKPGRLRPCRIGPDGERYRKYFVDLAGLGIRDLCFEADRLLILAGPSMDLDGPVRVLSWPGGLAAGRQLIVTADELEPLLEVPYRRGADHAEGIALLGQSNGRAELLVVYDSPAKDRLHDDGYRHRRRRVRAVDARPSSFIHLNANSGGSGPSDSCQLPRVAAH